MDDHQRPDGIAVTRFILQSIYAQSDDEKLEFEYESGNTNILVRCHVFILWALEWLKHLTRLVTVSFNIHAMPWCFSLAQC